MQTGRAGVVEISCEEVWREISNYLDDEISADLRTRMEEHFKGCKRCTAVLDGIRNVVQLFGDAAVLDLPAAFGIRLRQRLNR
jgi:anti-sigma factor RsiW